MSNTQSKIDSLQELNSKLLAEIIKLRKENAMLLDKEAGLMARIMELEQSAKENAENAKLRDAELNGRIAKLERSAKENEERFMKLKQKQSQNDKEKSNHIAKLDDNNRKIEQVNTLIPQGQSLVNTNSSCKTNTDNTSV